MASQVDFIIGILLLFIVLWNVFLGIELYHTDLRARAALARALQATIALSPAGICESKAGYRLVPPLAGAPEPYYVYAKNVGDLNQVAFCFYEKG